MQLDPFKVVMFALACEIAVAVLLYLFARYGGTWRLDESRSTSTLENTDTIPIAERNNGYVHSEVGNLPASTSPK